MVPSRCFNLKRLFTNMFLHLLEVVLEECVEALNGRGKNFCQTAWNMTNTSYRWKHGDWWSLGAGQLLHSFTHPLSSCTLSLFTASNSALYSSPPSATALLPSFVTVGLTLRSLVLITLNKLRNWATLKQPTSSSIQFHIVSLTFRDRVYFIMSAVLHQTTCVKFC